MDRSRNVDTEKTLFGQELVEAANRQGYAALARLVTQSPKGGFLGVSMCPDGADQMLECLKIFESFDSLDALIAGVASLNKKKVRGASLDEKALNLVGDILNPLPEGCSSELGAENVLTAQLIAKLDEEPLKTMVSTLDIDRKEFSRRMVHKLANFEDGSFKPMFIQKGRRSALCDPAYWVLAEAVGLTPVQGAAFLVLLTAFQRKLLTSFSFRDKTAKHDAADESVPQPEAQHGFPALEALRAEYAGRIRSTEDPNVALVVQVNTVRAAIEALRLMLDGSPEEIRSAANADLLAALGAKAKK